jgi:ERF superfamily
MSDPSNTDLTTQQGGLPVIQEGPGALLAALVSLAKNPDVNPQTVAAWAAIQERMEERQAEREFNEAFHRASTDMPRIKKNGSVEYKGKEAFKFATWEAIDAAIRPILQREGFALSFDTVPRQGDGGGIVVTGTLSHIGGHKRCASMPVALDSSGGKNNIQGMGSSFSYGKRYTTTALLNIITEGEDDCGVRGGMQFISAEQAAELISLMKQAGRDEVTLLERMTQGEVHSVGELQQQGYVMVKNTLGQIIAQRANKGQAQ